MQILAYCLGGLITGRMHPRLTAVVLPVLTSRWVDRWGAVVQAQFVWSRYMKQCLSKKICTRHVELLVASQSIDV